jgi:hypothetical protein
MLAFFSETGENFYELLAFQGQLQRHVGPTDRRQDPHGGPVKVQGTATSVLRFMV